MKRAVIAVLAAALVLLPGAPAAAAHQTAAHGAAAGWKLSFSTDFNGSSLPANTFTYGSVYTIGDSAWSAEYVKVSGGLLHLLMDHKSSQGQPYTSGGMGFNHPMTYGKFEWRAKVPVGKGIDSYGTLWPESDDDGSALLMEAHGKPGGEVMAITNGYGGGKNDKLIPGPFTDGFHTYTVETIPGSVRVYKDGVLKFSDTHAASVSRTLQFAMVTGDNYTGPADPGIAFPIEFQIDWVRAYTYVPGGAPAPTTTPAPSTTKSAPPTAKPSASNRPSSTVTPSTGPVVDGLSALPVAAEPSVSPKGPWVWMGLGALILVLAAGVARITWRRRRSG